MNGKGTVGQERVVNSRKGSKKEGQSENESEGGCGEGRVRDGVKMVRWRGADGWIDGWEGDYIGQERIVEVKDRKIKILVMKMKDQSEEGIRRG